jgi:hypothetical protein
MAIYESISSLGSVANSNLTPRLTDTYNTLTATWFSSSLALGLVALSALYVVTMDVNEQSTEEEKKERVIESIRRLPRSFWYIASICLTGYACLLPFFNSAQRFIASRFYEDDQTIAGLAVRYYHTHLVKYFLLMQYTALCISWEELCLCFLGCCSRFQY